MVGGQLSGKPRTRRLPPSPLLSYPVVLVPQSMIEQDLTQAIVSDQEAINRLMEQGQKMRTVGATAMNETSSRSHSIFTIVVEMNDVDDAGKDHIRVGKVGKYVGVSCPPVKKTVHARNGCAYIYTRTQLRCIAISRHLLRI